MAEPTVHDHAAEAPGIHSSNFTFLHLWQVARAVAEGIPVVGYLYWSLLDNYEWADGYRARFGLIGVDYAAQARSVRTSARRLADIIARSEL